MEERLHQGNSPKVLLFGLILVLLAFFAVEVFRVGGTPDIRIIPAMSAFGRKTPVRVEVSEPRRGLVRVKIEFYQGDQGVTLEDRAYQFGSQYSLWGSRTAAVQILRMTASFAGVWPIIA